MPRPQDEFPNAYGFVALIARAAFVMGLAAFCTWVISLVCRLRG